MLVARYFSILGSGLFLIPLRIFKLIPTRLDLKKTPLVITWCGLRGGISIALALSLPNTFPEVKDLFLMLTFVCVFFSIIVQGVSIPKFLQWINVQDLDDVTPMNKEVPEPKIDDEGKSNHEKFMNT